MTAATSLRARLDIVPCRDRLTVLLAVVGVAAGVALALVSQVVGSSFHRTTPLLGRTLVGDSQYQLDQRGPEGVGQERSLADVRRVPGVHRAVPLVEDLVSLRARNGSERSVDLIGIDPSLADMGSQRLQELTSTELPDREAIALPSSVANELDVRVGQMLNVESGVRPIRVRLSAILGERDIGGLAASSLALAPINGAQFITGLEGSISRIFVEVETGKRTTALAGLRRLAATTHLTLEPTGFESQMFAAAASPERKSENLFSWLGSALGFALALASALAFGPSSTGKRGEHTRPGTGSQLRLRAVDAAMLGALACVLGLGVGALLSIYALDARPTLLSHAFPVDETRVVTWRVVVIPIVVGMVATLIGSRHRCTTKTPSIAMGAVIAVSVLVGLWILGAQRNVEKGLGAQSHGFSFGADLWLLPHGGFDPFATSQFPISESEYASLPDVAAFGLYRADILTWGSRRVLVMAPAHLPGSGPYPTDVAADELGSARKRLDESGWAVLSRLVADEHHLRPGAAFTLPAPNPITLRVAAIVPGVGWPGGAIVINSADYVRAWNAAGTVSAVEIQAEPGASADLVRAELSKVLGSDYVIETAAERERRSYEAVGGWLLNPPFSVLVLVVCCALAIVTVSISFSLRQDPPGGTRNASITADLARSALRVVAVGCLIGAVLGVAGQLLISRALARASGLPVVVAVDPVLLVEVVAGVVAVALASAAASQLMNARPSAVPLSTEN
jgi:ABC-type lipoprotein release transport system permease subunit